VLAVLASTPRQAAMAAMQLSVLAAAVVVVAPPVDQAAAAAMAL